MSKDKYIAAKRKNRKYVLLILILIASLVLALLSIFILHAEPKDQIQEHIQLINVIAGAILGLITSVIAWHITASTGDENIEEIKNQLEKTTSIIAFEQKCKKLGIEDIGLVREDVIPKLNYNGILKKCKKRFYICAMTLETAVQNFEKVDEDGKFFYEYVNEKELDFRVLSADPYDQAQIECLYKTGIEKIGNEIKDPHKHIAYKIIEALTFFENKLPSEPSALTTTTTFVSRFLPHTFFILADNHLYLQPYLLNQNSVDGLTFHISQSLETPFHRYEDMIFQLYQNNEATPWKNRKQESGN